MADHRKFFRPRRLAFGGRGLPCASIFALSLMLLGVAHAEDAGLKNGSASLAAGKYDAAVRQLSTTINSDNVPPSEAAKALYLRGIAYRKLNQPSRAIADLGAAIWLGLPEGDRVKALVNRGLAYQSAGLSSQGEADIALARKSGGSGPVDQLIAEGGGSAEGAAAIAAFATEVRPGDQAPATRTAEASSQWTTSSAAEGPASAPKPPQDAAPSAWSTSVSGDEPKPSGSGNRLTRWFGSLTDSSDSSSAGAPPPQAASTPPPAPAAPRPAPQPMPAPSSWAAQTQTQTAETQAADTGTAGGGGSRFSRWFSSSKSAEAEPAAAPAPAPTAVPAGGGFRLQLATSRSEQEANALWKKVSSENQVVAGARPEIERVDIGNFGTFYSLKIGPFPDKAESLKVCNALKRNGVDCSLVTP